jgi:hypothetical protein
MLGSADYTATSGVSVVLAAGATAGDLVEVISFQVSSVLNAIPATAGSVGTTFLADSSVTTAKIAPGAVVQADLATGVAGTGPAFSAYCSTAQVIPNATGTKIAINTEIFDTNSNFDNVTNYRFTPTVAGYYQVCGGVYYSFSSGASQAWIYKNGVLIFASVAPSSVNGFLAPVSGLVYMNGSTDYLELYTYQNSGGNQSLIAGRQDLTYFFGSMVRAA